MQRLAALPSELMSIRAEVVQVGMRTGWAACSEVEGIIIPLNPLARQRYCQRKRIGNAELHQNDMP